MDMIVSPVIGVRLIDWSIESLVWKSSYHWGNRDHYIIFFNYGVEPTAFEFFFDLEV